jgi:hypothetical protein
MSERCRCINSSDGWLGSAAVIISWIYLPSYSSSSLLICLSFLTSHLLLLIIFAYSVLNAIPFDLQEFCRSNFPHIGLLMLRLTSNAPLLFSLQSVKNSSYPVSKFRLEMLHHEMLLCKHVLSNNLSILNGTRVASRTEHKLRYHGSRRYPG